MLGFLKKDFLILKNEAILFVPMIVIMISLLSRTFNFIFVFYSISSLVLLFGHDEKNDSLCYFSTFPNGRKNMVKARYVFFLIFNTILFIFILSLFIIKGTDLNYSDLYNISIASLSIPLVLSALMVPFIYKFGVTKGRFVLFGVVFGFALIGKFFENSLYRFLEYFSFFEKHTYLFLVFALLFYFVSYSFSLWVNNRKDY